MDWWDDVSDMANDLANDALNPSISGSFWGGLGHGLGDSAHGATGFGSGGSVWGMESFYFDGEEEPPSVQEPVIVVGQRIEEDPWNDLRYLDTVFVTGFMIDAAYEQGPFGFGGGGGGGGAPSPTPEPTPEPDLDCALMENNIDTMAELIESAIKNMPDWNAREYFAFIYLDASGSVQSSGLLPGTTVAETGNAEVDSAQIAALGTSIINNGGTLLAHVHNHPEIGYSSTYDKVNRSPSDADWNGFDTLTDPLQYGAPDGFAMYILGPDGKLREFHDDDRNDKTPDSDNDVRNGECGG